MKHAILSEEVKGLIDRRPPRIIRNGNLIFVVLLAGLLAGSWWIRVPSIVQAPLRFSLKNGQYHGQMRLAATAPAIPGQHVIIRTDDPSLAHLTGTVEAVSRISTDSSLIDIRLWGVTVSPGKDFSTQGEIIMENERLFDRFRGMARLWHR